jgi:hypothetical protein
MQSTTSSMSGGSAWTSSWRWAGSVQSSAVTVTVEVLAGRVEGAGSTFFRRSGRRAGMSVAVYLRTSGLSASARRPVPALFVDVGSRINGCGWGERLWEIYSIHAPEFKNVRLTELFVVK